MIKSFENFKEGLIHLIRSFILIFGIKFLSAENWEVSVFGVSKILLVTMIIVVSR